jgi:hypothetical protein
LINTVKYRLKILDNRIKKNKFMKKYYKSALLCLVTGLLCSCSTILNTTTQDVEIKTKPSNAKITIDGKKYGTTPQVVNLERGSNHVVKLELDGFDPYETQLTRKISPWFWFNVLNAIVPGVLIDYMSGSMYRLLPDSFEAELIQAKPPEKPAKK